MYFCLGLLGKCTAPGPALPGLATHPPACSCAAAACCGAQSGSAQRDESRENRGGGLRCGWVDVHVPPTPTRVYMCQSRFVQPPMSTNQIVQSLAVERDFHAGSTIYLFFVDKIGRPGEAAASERRVHPPMKLAGDSTPKKRPWQVGMKGWRLPFSGSPGGRGHVLATANPLPYPYPRPLPVPPRVADAGARHSLSAAVGPRVPRSGGTTPRSSPSAGPPPDDGRRGVALVTVATAGAAPLPACRRPVRLASARGCLSAPRGGFRGTATPFAAGGVPPRAGAFLRCRCRRALPS